jgi:hypothetical protein
MPRTGTTSPFHVCGRHPDIFQPFRKEVGFFLFHHARGERWLRSVYRGRRPGQVAIDVTPEYFFSEEAIARIRTVTPGARVVLGLREPLSFARSLHGEYRRRFDTPDFETFVRGYAYRRAGETVAFDLAGGVLPRMLKAWRRAFGDRLLCYDYGLFRRQPLTVLQALESFLGLPAYFDRVRPPVWRLNAGDRRQSRLLDFLLNREELASVVERVIPRGVLVALARGFYRLSAGTSAPRDLDAEPTTSNGVDPDEMPSWVREGRAAFREVFREAPLVLGSGRPLVLESGGRDQSTSTVT